MAEPVAEAVSDGVVTDAEVVGAVDAAVQAVIQGNWGLVLAIVLMIGLWAWNKYGMGLEWIPRQYLPWVSMGVATLGHLLGAYVSGVDPQEAVVQGLLVGLGAAGAWSATGPLRKRQK